MVKTNINHNFNQKNDLLSLHYDHAPDRDDGHATVAGKVLVESFGIENYLVVGGTYGKNGDSYRSDSELIMDSTWGSNNWINAHEDRNAAIEAVEINFSVVDSFL